MALKRDIVVLRTVPLFEALDDYEWETDPEEDADLLKEFDDFGMDPASKPPIEEEDMEEEKEDLDGEDGGL